MSEEVKQGGLYHSFFLLDWEKYQPGENNERSLHLDEIFQEHNCVNLHDDHLNYIGDSLLWIPTYNYWKKEISSGLNLHGNTVIRKNGAVAAKKILTSWANLFRCGTKTFELTGNYVYDPEIPDSGFYEKISVDRDFLVKKLETFIFYCEEVVKTDDRKFIWHFGI